MGHPAERLKGAAGILRTLVGLAEKAAKAACPVIGTPPAPNTRDGGVVVDTEAVKALEFYNRNYTIWPFVELGQANKNIVLGREPFECRFCGGRPPEKTFRNTAHAVSQLLGNKVLKSRYECDDCNKRFSAFEDDLAKMTLPMRTIGGVIGKNGIPKLVTASRWNASRPTMEFKDGGLHVSHDAGDIGFVEDEATKTLTLTYVYQPYRPLGVYKALCKSAFTLLPSEELVYFTELRQWLLRSDLTTDQVYARGSHICHATFVPAFQPFKQPLVCLLKRRDQVDAPYMCFFIASGNVSYQIFLPCPSKDAHLRGRIITTPGFPHIFQLKPLLSPAPTQIETIDLGSPDRTEKRTGTMSWRYENKIKIT